MSKKTPKQSSLLKQYTPHIIIVIFLAIGLAAVYREFYPLTVQEPAPPTASNSNLARVPTSLALFETEVLLDRSNTFVTVPFKFENETYVIWLVLDDEEDELGITRLVHHPQLATIDWPVISTDSLSLYQKEPTYDDLDDFLNNPPQNAAIVADFPILESGQYPGLSGQELSPSIDLANTDYILTTFRPLRMTGDILNYDTIVDASSAIVSPQNTLIWRLQASQATEEKPYYVGGIHVDYRQQ